MVVLPNTPLEGALKIAEKVHQQLSTLKMPHEASAVETYVTCSIGAVSASPHHSDDLKAFIETADDALYQAKDNGRNQTIAGTFSRE